MGVLLYLFVRLIRSMALRGLICGPHHPTLPSEHVPEVVFSDDSRLFALRPQYLAQTLNLAAEIANRAGATPNPTKLGAFHLSLGEQGLIYGGGSLPCTLVDLVFQKKRLCQ